MELQQLRYFLAVARTESVTAAAEELVVSPSAVSRAVSGLERETGVPLLVREGRVVRLSRHGADFAGAAGAALADLERSVDLARQRAGVTSGVVSLGFLTSLGAQLVPELIRAHRAAYPDVTYRLHQNSGRGVVDDVLAGRADLCLSVADVFPDPRLTWSPLTQEPLVLTVPEGHRLTTARRVRLGDLADEPFVALGLDFTLRHVVDAAFRDHGVAPPRIVFEGTDVATLRGLIASGVGVGFLPQAPTSYAALPVCEVALADATITREISVGRVEGRPLPPVAEAFLATAAELHPQGRRTGGSGPDTMTT